MPKIGFLSLNYEGERSTQHEIWYSRKQLFYIKGLSAEFLGLAKVRSMGYETEHDLISAMRTACIKYRELKKKSKKVILYKCQASLELRMEDLGNSRGYQGLLPGISKNIRSFGGFPPFASIGFEYEVAKLVDDGVNKEYYQVNSVTGETGQYSHGGHGWQEIDYTKEREEFFESIISAMKNMVVSLSKFFGSDSEKAALFIENNQRLLPGH